MRRLRIRLRAKGFVGTALLLFELLQISCEFNRMKRNQTIWSQKRLKNRKVCRLRSNHSKLKGCFDTDHTKRQQSEHFRRFTLFVLDNVDDSITAFLLQTK